jgi:protease II
MLAVVTVRYVTAGRVQKAIHRLRPAWNRHDVSFAGRKRSTGISNVESGAWSATSFAHNDERAAWYPNLGRVGVENQNTEDFLGVHNTEGLFPILEGEILRASALNDAVASLDASLGPTGKYIYHWGIADGIGDVQDDHRVAIPTKRVYQRRLANDTSDSYQEVLEHEWKTSSLLDMSLSIDEIAIAFLIQDNSGLVHAVVRIIDSGRQHEMTIPSKNFVAIEFGPVHDKLHSLFLVEADTMGRPATVHATTVNLDILQSTDSSIGASVPSWECIFHCDDPAVHVDVQRTKGLDFVAINARTLSTNEAYLVRQVHDKLQLIRQREQDIQYHVDVGTNRDVYILAQGCDEAGELSLFRASIDDLPLPPSFGARLSPASKHFAIVDFDLFQEYIALYERSTVDGAHRIRVRNRRSTKSEALVPLPRSIQNADTISPAGNMYFKSATLRFYVGSPLVPTTLVEYNMERGQWLTPIQGALASGDLVQTRLLVPSKDGTMVPLSLFYRADLVARVPLDRSVRIVLTGYGAYGASVSLAYDPTLQPLLDRGCVLAFAHTRGGGELGRNWHVKGRGTNKASAVDDYLACAEYATSLFSDRPVQLIARARSAGGILIGAAVNQRPSLFHKVVLTSAFLNLDATMRQPLLHLTQHEWEEYGNPLTNADEARDIAAICPVLNVPQTDSDADRPRRPQFLLMGALDDTSVPIENAIAYGSRIRERLGAKVLFYFGLPLRPWRPPLFWTTNERFAVLPHE